MQDGRTRVRLSRCCINCGFGSHDGDVLQDVSLGWPRIPRIDGGGVAWTCEISVTRHGLRQKRVRGRKRQQLRCYSSSPHLCFCIPTPSPPFLLIFTCTNSSGSNCRCHQVHRDGHVRQLTAAAFHQVAAFPPCSVHELTCFTSPERWLLNAVDNLPFTTMRVRNRKRSPIRRY